MRTEYEKYLEQDNMTKDRVIDGLRHNAIVLQNIINELNQQLKNKTMGRVVPAMFKGANNDDS